MHCGCVTVSLLGSSSSEREATIVADAAPSLVSLTPHHSQHPAIQQLIDKHASLVKDLQVFQEDSHVKRGNIVSKFASLHAVLDSAERAALVAYDGEVRAVMKQLEIEAEGVEVLAQQLSGKLLAFGITGVSDGDLTLSDTTDKANVCRNVDVVLPDQGLCHVLGSCWALVRLGCEDSEEQALAIAKAELELVEQVDASIHAIKSSMDAVLLTIKATIHLNAISRSRRLTCWSVQGKHLSTIRIKESRYNSGVAVNSDGTLMAVCNQLSNVVTMYSLPDGEEICSFRGDERRFGTLMYPESVCFAGSPSNNVLVADGEHRRVVEFCETGEPLRTIGQDTLVSWALSVDANKDVVVVGQQTEANCVVVFEYSSGNAIRSFGTFGLAIGQLYSFKHASITPDGGHVLVVDSARKASMLLLFRLDGGFVRAFGDCEVIGRPSDARITQSGEIIVLSGDNHRAVVLRADDDSLVSWFGSYNDADGQFMNPSALSIHGNKIYIVDSHTARVQVFE